MTILDKLRQRKLAQWGLAYLAGAWVLLQVLQYLAGVFHWPAQALRVATILAAVGFLGVLVLAWYHGERGRQQASALEVILLTLVLLSAGALAWVFRGESEMGMEPAVLPAEQNSIAVLPFKQQSAKSDDEYFGDGIAEEILNALAHTPGLRVAAPSSSFAFKEGKTTIGEIGRKLRVANVLEGSVRRSGQVVRITVQLIDAKSGYQLWSDKFDRELKDIFTVQEEVSRTIVDKLQIHLTQPQTALVARTTNNDAFDYYLRGRYFWAKRTPDALQKSIQHFEHALQLDPNYADAHAGLASVLLVLPLYTDLKPTEVQPRARAAALRGLELDSTLASAWAALAYIRMSYDHDWTGADEAFRKAVQLNPSDANTHLWFGDFQGGRGNTSGAVEQYALGVQLDPFSSTLHVSLGWGYLWIRRFADAAKEMQLAIDLDSTLVDAHTHLARARLYEGRTEEAIGGLEDAATRSGRRAVELGFLGNAYATTGRTTDAQLILKELQERRKKSYVTPLADAMIETGLGNLDRAFAALEQSRQNGDMWITENNADLVFDPLRGDRRWPELLKRLGISR